MSNLVPTLGTRFPEEPVRRNFSRKGPTRDLIYIYIYIILLEENSNLVKLSLLICTVSHQMTSNVYFEVEK